MVYTDLVNLLRIYNFSFITFENIPWVLFHVKSYVGVWQFSVWIASLLNSREEAALIEGDSVVQTSFGANLLTLLLVINRRQSTNKLLYVFRLHFHLGTWNRTRKNSCNYSSPWLCLVCRLDTNIYILSMLEKEYTYILSIVNILFVHWIIAGYKFLTSNSSSKLWNCWTERKILQQEIIIRKHH